MCQKINRLSFRQVFDIHRLDETPNEKAVWHARCVLSWINAFDLLFSEFHNYHNSKSLCFNGDKIKSVVFVEASKQCNTHEENKQIKERNVGDR